MACTKAQLLALFHKLKKEIIDNCGDINCAIEVIDTYLTIIQDGAESEAWRELIKYIETYKNAETPSERLEALDSAVQEVVVPYGRGADRPEFLEMIQSWASIVGLVRSWLRLLEEENLDPRRRKELQYILDSIVKEEVYSAWEIVVAATFGEKDLAKNIVAVIHNLPGPQAPQPIQSSLTHILQSIRGEKK